MVTLTRTELGPYRLGEVIRRGGMATVYKGYQPSLNRDVAVKVLEHHQDDRFVKRFKTEAQLVAQLQHPNILQVYDYGEQDGVLYLVCPYIENGATLADVGKPMPLAAALEVMQRILAALEYAHARGIVHRDVKPSNVLLPTLDWPLLADFGIVKLLDNAAEDLTAAGQVIGTAAYMAPEQAAGEPVDARTDLYAAGVVLYELVTGKTPFGAGPRSQVLARHTSEPPPAPRSVNPTLPASVELILLRALAKRPGDRYQSASAMAADLKRLNAQEQRATGSATEAATQIAPAALTSLRSRWVYAALALVLLIGFIAAGVLVWRGGASPAEPSRPGPDPGSGPIAQAPDAAPSRPGPNPGGGPIAQTPDAPPRRPRPRPDAGARPRPPDASPSPTKPNPPGAPAGSVIVDGSSAKARPCPAGWACLYQNNHRSGVRLRIPSGVSIPNLRELRCRTCTNGRPDSKGTFNDQMTSWENQSGRQYCWWFHAGYSGESHKMPSGYIVNVLPRENDQASSIGPC